MIGDKWALVSTVNQEPENQLAAPRRGVEARGCRRGEGVSNGPSVDTPR